MFDYDAWKNGYYEDLGEYDIGELTEEDIKSIALAKEEEVFDKWLAEQECDRCVCY